MVVEIPEIDFGRIRSAGSGGAREAFEQLVCELAAEDCPVPGARFIRIHGAGGDGGVECFWTLPDGSEHGWQAKFWVGGGDVDKAQLDGSVETALRIHPQLAKYTFAIPVDPTGPTGGRGQSLYEKVYGDGGWLAGWRTMATAKGMAVEFVVEWRTDLLTRLQRVDLTGARTRYWFDVDLVRDAWWHDRLDDAVRAARPRYVPELTVDVPAVHAIAAFCGDPSWLSVLDGKIGGLKECLNNLGRGGLGRDDADPLAADVLAVRRVGEELMAALETWRTLPTDETRRSLGPALEAARVATSDAEHVESRAMTEKHADGWDSPGWRQFQAEYQVSFPAAHIDSLRALLTYLDDLTLFLDGTLEQLPGARCMLLIGPVGTGKTFVACDVVSRRLAEGGPSLVVHGRWFSGGDVLIQLRDHLQLPSDLTGEEALALLNQAGRADGKPVLLVIDALNETRPRTTWRNELDRIVALIERHDHLRVVFTVRSHYQAQVIPPGLDLPTFIHRGFEGVEFEAVAEYADYYNLEPPTAPPVHGEFDNPLFLRLLCEALKAGGRLSLDQAVMGIDELVPMLLNEINTRISDQLDAPRADRIVHRAMTAFADAFTAGPRPSLERTTASNLVRSVWPDHTAEGSLLEALISEGLLAEDVDPPGARDGENVVTIAFERLGHHMVIESALSGMTTANEVAEALSEGRLRQVIGLGGELDRGLLEALSVAVVHRLGVEITAFNAEIADQDAAIAAVIAGLPWRSVESITDQTREVVLEALETEAVFPEAVEMLFRLATRPDHPLNADFLDELLSTHSMGERDSYLIPWLHQSRIRQCRGPADLMGKNEGHCRRRARDLTPMGHSPAVVHRMPGSACSRRRDAGRGTTPCPPPRPGPWSAWPVHRSQRRLDRRTSLLRHLCRAAARRNWFRLARRSGSPLARRLRRGTAGKRCDPR